MDPQFFIPVVCPVNFVSVEHADIPQYVSKFMDDFLYKDRLNKYQVGVQPYAQPWSTVDSMRFQFFTNEGQAQINLRRCVDGAVIKSVLTVQKQGNPYVPGMFIYEAEMTTNVPPGKYYLHMFTDLEEWLSEPLDIQQEHTPTLLIEYSNSKFYGGAVFETGYSPSIRIAGMLRMKAPVTKDTVFEDQILDLQMVKSQKIRLWEILVGVPTDSPMGIPDWMQDKFTDILGCDTVKIDGRSFTRNEGFKWEEADNSYNDALKGLRGELRETITRPYKVSTPSGPLVQRMAMILTVSTKGFGDTSQAASSDLVTFTNVE